jgi:hypothetical protein
MLRASAEEDNRNRELVGEKEQRGRSLDAANGINAMGLRTLRPPTQTPKRPCFATTSSAGLWLRLKICCHGAKLRTNPVSIRKLAWHHLRPVCTPVMAFDSL